MQTALEAYPCSKQNALAAAGKCMPLNGYRVAQTRQRHATRERCGLRPVQTAFGIEHLVPLSLQRDVLVHAAALSSRSWMARRVAARSMSVPGVVHPVAGEKLAIMLLTYLMCGCSVSCSHGAALECSCCLMRCRRFGCRIYLLGTSEARRGLPHTPALPGVRPPITLAPRRRSLACSHCLMRCQSFGCSSLLLGATEARCGHGQRLLP